MSGGRPHAAAYDTESPSAQQQGVRRRKAVPSGATRLKESEWRKYKMEMEEEKRKQQGADYSRHKFRRKKRRNKFANVTPGVAMVQLLCLGAAMYLLAWFTGDEDVCGRVKEVSCPDAYFHWLFTLNSRNKQTPYSSDAVIDSEISTKDWHRASALILDDAFDRLQATDCCSVGRLSADSGAVVAYSVAPAKGYPHSGDALVLVSGTRHLDAPIGRALQSAVADYLASVYAIIGNSPKLADLKSAQKRNKELKISSPLFPPHWHLQHLTRRIPLPTVIFLSLNHGSHRSSSLRFLKSEKLWEISESWILSAIEWLPQWLSAEVIHYAYLFDALCEWFAPSDARAQQSHEAKHKKTHSSSNEFEVRNAKHFEENMAVVTETLRSLVNEMDTAHAFDNVTVLDIGSGNVLHQSISGIDSLFVDSGTAKIDKLFSTHKSQDRVHVMDASGAKMCAAIRRVLHSQTTDSRPKDKQVCARIDFGTMGARRTRHTIHLLDALLRFTEKRGGKDYKQVLDESEAYVRKSVFVKTVKWKKHVIRRGVRAILKFFYDESFQ